MESSFLLKSVYLTSFIATIILLIKFDLTFDTAMSSNSVIDYLHKEIPFMHEANLTVRKRNKPDTRIATKMENDFKKRKKKITESFMYKQSIKYPPKLIAESNCSSPFITVSDSGRLGNKICQLMSLMVMRKHFGVRFAVLPITYSILSSIFQNISYPMLPDSCFSPDHSSSTKAYFNIMYRKFFETFVADKINLTIDNPTNVSISHFNFIEGHPCPISNLLRMHRKEFQKELRINDTLIVEAKRKLEKALKEKNLPEETTLVSIHIRRTDYLGYMRKLNRLIPRASFYKRAMQFYRERCIPVLFVIITDDKKWAQKYLSVPDATFPGDSNIKSPDLDYAIITMCDHHIFGLGTFGSTSAFLGKGSVAYFVGREITADYLSNLNFTCNSSTAYIPISS